MSLSPGRNEESIITKSDVYANNEFFDRWVSVNNVKSDSEPKHRLNAYYNGTIGNLKIDFNSDFYRSSQFSEINITESSQEFDDRIVKSSNRIENRLFATRLVLSYPLFGGNFSAGNEYTRTHRNDDYMTDIDVIPSSNTSIHDQNNSFCAE